MAFQIPRNPSPYKEFTALMGPNPVSGFIMEPPELNSVSLLIMVLLHTKLSSGA